MKMFVAGGWVDKSTQIEVRNPFDNTVIDTVPKADGDDIERALAAAVEGAKIMRHLPGYERAKILRKAAELMGQRGDKLGRLISTEEGKILSEGVFEVSRAGETIELSADEAKRLGGEVLPIDGARVVRANWASRSACRAASWRRSRRLTFHSTWCATRSVRRLPRATP